MATREDKKSITLRKFDPEKSIKRAERIKNAISTKTKRVKWSINVPGHENEYVWDTQMDRLALIRTGLPYESIDVISKKADLPVKKMLQLIGLAQTTYNKRKRDNEFLSGRDSELILILTELLGFGLEVFNNENEKFQRWLKKPNASLGNATPESLFDSLTGIQEVRNSLNRLEYGNMA
ncbi:antitoxin [Adhaeribacter arboris]|uniref:Antitoxin n=1 Tax=Adhaeribacter arboris TaxID=2072846 RepID=A0A2T2YF40_9BACT|nr:antitoxin Xre/MbcA/ParS toxin-binding domain-containing protein [Adhaeribacter arboris]PSR54078.1 antitoxin [Adhaeribacter arboris]